MTVTCDQCKFPFSYKDIEYNSCTKKDAEKLWCATVVNEDREVKNFGYCEEVCSSENEKIVQSKKTKQIGENDVCGDSCKSPNNYCNKYEKRCDCLPGYKKDTDGCKCIEGRLLAHSNEPQKCKCLCMCAIVLLTRL